MELADWARLAFNDSSPLMPDPEASAIPSPETAEEQPSFLKLAMRNMVRKGRQSLFHFGLTAVGLIAFLLLIAWLGRPHLPG
jgi:hypothetical protein